MPLDEQSRKDPPPGPEHDNPDQPDERDATRHKVRPYVWIGLGVLLVVAIAGGFWYWWSTRNEETTDDAFTDGRAIAIAPQVSGSVVSLDVTDNEFVHRGQPLIHIDPRDYQAALQRAKGALTLARGQRAGAEYAAQVARRSFPGRLDEARAAVATAQANLFRAQTDYDRQIHLPKAATTQQEVDNATAAVRSAEAQLRQAQAQEEIAEPVPQNIGQADALVTQLAGQEQQAEAVVAQAELNLEWCVVRAPSDGWVTKRAVEQGNFVQQGQQVMDIVAPDIWVTANFKETQLTRMRPGQPVRIAVDAYPSMHLRGHIDSVQRGSGARFSAFPPENATGNFVKIVQRVPVRIDIDSGLNPQVALPLGISVEPTVDVK
jgi:membrane fusion protein (multidrug efflux system)